MKILTDEDRRVLLVIADAIPEQPARALRRIAGPDHDAENAAALAVLTAAMRPERAPVPAVDPSWSTPDALTACHATHSPRSTEIL